MKHKTLCTFIIWLIITCIFELPLTWTSVRSALAVAGISDFFIIIVNIYIVASLIALVLAKYAVRVIESIVVDMKELKKEVRANGKNGH